MLDDGKPGKIVLMGDLNAKDGRREDGENSVGLHGYNDRNQRGTRLVEFAESNNLKILNSFFKKRDKKKWTWESPNGNTHNEIDLIMARDRTMFQDVDVISKFEFESDHRFVRARIRNSAKM